MFRLLFVALAAAFANTSYAPLESLPTPTPSPWQQHPQQHHHHQTSGNDTSGNETSGTLGNARKTPVFSPPMNLYYSGSAPGSTVVTQTITVLELRNTTAFMFWALQYYFHTNAGEPPVYGYMGLQVLRPTVYRLIASVWGAVGADSFTASDGSYAGEFFEFGEGYTVRNDNWKLQLGRPEHQRLQHLGNAKWRVTIGDVVLGDLQLPASSTSLLGGAVNFAEFFGVPFNCDSPVDGSVLWDNVVFGEGAGEAEANAETPPPSLAHIGYPQTLECAAALAPNVVVIAGHGGIIVNTGNWSGVRDVSGRSPATALSTAAIMCIAAGVVIACITVLLCVFFIVLKRVVVRAPRN